MGGMLLDDTRAPDPAHERDRRSALGRVHLLRHRLAGGEAHELVVVRAPLHAGARLASDYRLPAPSHDHRSTHDETSEPSASASQLFRNARSASKSAVTVLHV